MLTQIGTGLRVGELLALRLSEVDFLRREVRVEEQIHPRTRERMILKTPSARRTVPMPQVVVDALAAHLAEFPANDEGYVFTNAEDRAYQAHTYQQMLSYRAKRAKLPHTTTHDLRHTPTPRTCWRVRCVGGFAPWPPQRHAGHDHLRAFDPRNRRKGPAGRSTMPSRVARKCLPPTNTLADLGVYETKTVWHPMGV